METNYLTDLMLPLSLAIIMLGMGLSLTPADFKRVVLYPKAAAIGFVNQIILLPLVGFLLVYLFGLNNLELAVGIMVLAACPGGPTSNLISHISRGDTALSITMTAISSMVAIITIPLIVNFSLAHFLQQGEYVPLPVFETIVKLTLVTLLPVTIGMFIRSRARKFAFKMDKPVKIVSGILLFLIIFAAINTNRDIFVQSFRDVGPIALALNLVMLFFGYLSARMAKLNITQSITISIETGIQNGTLGILIASTLLLNDVMAISPAIYSLIMFMTAGFIIAWMNLRFRGKRLVVR
ncbi:MAG: bile acid:sodium symporter family protein [Bacteroides sp.]|jgi:BASS family bile acid:Na+ symporter|nr:bile acid:sodium symporter family protein [Bacteroides sp.]